MALYKIFLAGGVALVAIGLGLFLAHALHLPIGRLPGDIVIARGHYSLYFPITTCLLMSLIVTILLRIFRI